ncbi:hypothetical protein [Methanospirillum lacunae]
MLTRQLRALEEDRLVSRTEFPGMPHHEDRPSSRTSCH